MLTTEQYFLGRIAEEAAEVAHRAMKAQLFGLNEVQNGQPGSNWDRLLDEREDLDACVWLLARAYTPGATRMTLPPLYRNKTKKLLKHSLIALEQGQIGQETIDFLEGLL